MVEVDFEREDCWALPGRATRATSWDDFFRFYSEEGMRKALEQYMNSKGYPVNPVFFRRGIL
ncbi:MAG: hypothetical protein Fur0011_3560 [Candidatus Microgenomates bacterium]